MKSLFTFLLIGCSLYVATAVATPHVEKTQSKEMSVLALKKSKEITCQGRLSPPSGIRRMARELNAFLNEENISIQFHRNVGLVRISIVDAAGASVYESVFDTGQGNLVIPTGEISFGTHTLLFQNDNGKIWGEFAL